MTNAIRKYTHVSLKKHEPNTETSSNSGFIGFSLKSIASHLFTRPIVSHTELEGSTYTGTISEGQNSYSRFWYGRLSKFVQGNNNYLYFIISFPQIIRFMLVPCICTKLKINADNRISKRWSQS